MRDIEWDLIQEGDQLDYLAPPSKDVPKPKPVRFIVFKLIEGKVQAVRHLRNSTGVGVSFAQTEIAVIEQNSDRWTYARVKPKVVVTGGFEVTRAADNHAKPEYDKCPTDLEKSKKPTRKDTEPE